MRRPASPLFALACAFFLLLAQGTAFAHWIGHLGDDLGTLQDAARATPQEASDGEAHAGAEDLCPSCLTYAGIVAAPPVAMAPSPASLPASVPRRETVSTRLVSRPIIPYGARAPPSSAKA